MNRPSLISRNSYGSQSERDLDTLADELPENATWDDVMEEVRFRRAVEMGIRAADRGEFATPEETQAFARWGVNITA